MAQPVRHYSEPSPTTHQTSPPSSPPLNSPNANDIPKISPLPSGAYPTLANSDPILLQTLYSAAGVTVLKYGRSGKPHPTGVRISVENGSKDPKLVWGKKAISLYELKEVKAGRITPVFVKYDSENPKEDGAEDRSLSLIFFSRTLDIELLPKASGIRPTKSDRDGWITFLKGMIDHSATTGAAAGNGGGVADGGRGHGSIIGGGGTLGSGNYSGTSLPFNVQHVTHVSSDLKWTGEDLDKSLIIKRKLGEGSFGSVYLATHRTAGFEVAVKILHSSSSLKEEEKKEIKREVDILKLCKHPFIVTYFGSWVSPSKEIWILMDYCACGSISHLLYETRKEKQLDEDALAYITYCTLHSLVYLHSKSIVHRDIKPGNLLVNRQGQIRLGDFGLSKVLKSNVLTDVDDLAPQKAQEHGGVDESTGAGRIVGSPLYMPPEVLEGKTPEYRSDIWALGISLIELAEGHVPHEELTSIYRIMKAIKTGPAPQLISKHWSAPFRDFISKCCSKNLFERSDASQLLEHGWIQAHATALNERSLSPILKVFSELEAKRAKEEEKERLRKMKEEKEKAKKKDKKGKGLMLSFFSFIGKKPGKDSITGNEEDELSEDESETIQNNRPKAASPPQRANQLAPPTKGKKGDKTIVGESSVIHHDNNDSFDPSMCDDDGDTMSVSGESTVVLRTAPRPAAPPAVPPRKANETPAKKTHYRTPTAPGKKSSNVSPRLTVKDGQTNGWIRCNVHDIESTAISLGIEKNLALRLAALLLNNHASPQPPTSTPSSAYTPASPTVVDSSNDPSSPSVSTSITATPSPAPSGDKWANRSKPRIYGVPSTAGNGASSVAKEGLDAPEKNGTSKTPSTPSVNPSAVVDSSPIPLHHSPSLNATSSTAPSTSRDRSDSESVSEKKDSGIKVNVEPPSPTLSAVNDDPLSEVPATSRFPTPSKNVPLEVKAECEAKLEQACIAVSGLSRNDITALKKMTGAVPPVKMAISAIAILFEVRPVNRTDLLSKGNRATKRSSTMDYWQPAQAVLVKPSFLNQLKTFDFEKLSPPIIDLLHSFAIDTDIAYTPEVVSKASLPAGVMWNWIRAIYEYVVRGIGYRPLVLSFSPDGNVICDEANRTGDTLPLNALTLGLPNTASQSSHTPTGNHVGGDHHKSTAAPPRLSMGKKGGYFPLKDIKEQEVVDERGVSAKKPPVNNKSDVKEKEAKEKEQPKEGNVKRTIIKLTRPATANPSSAQTSSAVKAKVDDRRKTMTKNASKPNF